MCAGRELIQKHEVCIRVLGDLEMLPRDVQEIVAKTMTMTRNNKRLVGFVSKSRTYVFTSISSRTLTTRT